MDAGPRLGAEITSIRSPRVKAARQLARRAFRQQSRLFLAEGPQPLREALALPGVVTEIFSTAQARDRHASLLSDARAGGIPVHLVSGEVMAELAQTITPQGLLATCRFLDVSIDALATVRPRLVAMLACVRDPGNAGTMLRTADAAGADGVVFSDASVDPYNSKCVRASAGSIFHLPLVTGVPVAQAVAALREAGLRVLAAAASARNDLYEQCRSGDLSRPTAWLFGNEAWGLPGDVIALADEAISVPIYGRAESLNLAAAAAVCLYASAQAARNPPAHLGLRP
jgi:TrmH family RNA methyltransferase